MSGMEIMLKSMGMGHVIELAQQLATQGTLDKILKFADGLDELNARLQRIETMLIEWNGYDSDGNIVRTGTAAIPYSGSERPNSPDGLASNGFRVSPEPRTD